jgi:hypothetical protein
LASKTIPGLGVRHGDTTYYKGDRVMFHVPMRKFGIENGFTGTVLKVNPVRRHVSVRLDNESPAKRGKKSLRKSKFVTIPLFRMDHAAMSLGYAATLTSCRERQLITRWFFSAAICSAKSWPTRS